MSTLAAAVAIGDTQLTIDTPMTGVEVGGFAVKIDDELLLVGGVDYRNGTTLALKFPATATHDAGATVTPVLDAFTTSAASPFAGVTEQTVYSRTVTLTDAQIKALPSTPIELVPAPGAGKIVVWLAAHLLLDATGGAYVLADGGELWQLCYIGGAELPHEASGFVKPGSIANTGWATFPPLTAYNGTEGYLQRGIPFGTSARFVNRALAIADIYNGVDDYTGGDASNTMDVTVLYAVVDV
jgi:hypothetical protein